MAAPLRWRRAADVLALALDYLPLWVALRGAYVDPLRGFLHVRALQVWPRAARVHHQPPRAARLRRGAELLYVYCLIPIHTQPME